MEPSKDPLLVFDGDCAFCTSAVERLRKALPRFPPSTPWQWIDLDEYALTAEDVASYVWVITPRHHYAGHLALSALLRMQRGFGWRLAGWLLATPPISWAAAIGYRWVAANRHRLPGGSPACALPRS